MADPPFTGDWAYCAWAALELLRDRRASCAAGVGAGKMTQEAADESIATARAIVTQWRWVLDPALPPLPADGFGASEPAMLDQLRRLAPWARGRWDAAPADRDLRERALLVEALLWHQQPTASDVPHAVYCGLIARRNPSWRVTPAPVEDAGIYRALGLAMPGQREAA